MKLSIAGQDRTQDLGPALRQQAATMARGDDRHQPARIPVNISALALAQTKSDAEYLDHFIRLIRYRDAVDTLDFEIPRKPGVIGLGLARFKAFLWKLLRYQHDRITFRQNLINGLYSSALEYEVALRQKAVADLDQRLQRLEARLAPLPPPEKPS